MLLGFSTRAHAQAAKCHGSDDVSDVMIGVFKKLMGADSGYRKGLGLPVAADSLITLVTDAAICGRAGQAVDSVSLADDSTQVLSLRSHPLYVFKIGPAYAVRSTTDTNQNYDFVLFFGGLWDFLSIGAF